MVRHPPTLWGGVAGVPLAVLLVFFACERTALGSPPASAVTQVAWQVVGASSAASAQDDNDDDDDEEESSPPPTRVAQPASDHRLLSASLEAGAASSAVWRGISVTQGPALDMSGEADTSFGLALSVSCAVILGDEPNRGKPTLLDITPSYSFEIGRLTVEPLAHLYLLTHNPNVPWTLEAGLRLSLDLGVIDLFLDQSVDIGDKPDAYFGVLGTTFEHDWSWLSLELSADLGAASARFNQSYWDLSKTTLDVFEAGASGEVSVWRGLYVRPYLEFSALVDGDIRKQASRANVLVAGIAIGWSTDDGS
jgi:hypothetical protein